MKLERDLSLALLNEAKCCAQSRPKILTEALKAQGIVRACFPESCSLQPASPVE